MSNVLLYAYHLQGNDNVKSYKPNANKKLLFIACLVCNNFLVDVICKCTTVYILKIMITKLTIFTIFTALLVEALALQAGRSRIRFQTVS